MARGGPRSPPTSTPVVPPGREEGAGLAPPSGKRPRELTREELLAALGTHHQNLTRTAESLRIAVNTLKARMAELGIPRPGAKGQP
jgi:DNA-binding NtrC family response regulator